MQLVQRVTEALGPGQWNLAKKIEKNALENAPIIRKSESRLEKKRSKFFESDQTKTCYVDLPRRIRLINVIRKLYEKD